MNNSIQEQKKVVFLTGTRADYGKLKSLIAVLQADSRFYVAIFVTGMHMLKKFGHTHIEIEVSGFKNIYRYVNQNSNDDMDQILAKTVNGFGDFVKELKPDLIVIHGDRIEALAGSIVGSLNNILTAHIEGGEVSGTIDEMMRHAITKLSHLHFCSNQRAKRRLVQLGELDDSIHVIGSPDIDAMKPENLPAVEEVKNRYSVNFSQYSIAIFHPVTTDLDNLEVYAKSFCDALIASGLNYVVIYPNNDRGSDLILREYRKLLELPNFIVIPSMRFEYFLSLLRSADFVVGNSSAGVMEAPHFGVPTINVGSRQHNRGTGRLIDNVGIESKAIYDAILRAKGKRHSKRVSQFGKGDSAKQFHKILSRRSIWKTPIQKHFVDAMTKR